MRRVVITGLGMVSPLGNDVATTWKNILASKCGVRFIEHFDTSKHSTKFAGLVQDLDPSAYMPAKDVKNTDPFIQYGVVAGGQAIADSGLLSSNDFNCDLTRFGAIVGSGIGGIGSIESNNQTLLAKGPMRITPFFITASLVNMIAGNLSIQYGLKGPNLAVSTACASSTHALIMGAKMIKYGDAEIMLAGGAERASTPLCMAGFNAMRALSTRNDDPSCASRPWDEHRDGFVLGDGAGMLVLEEYEHAKRRGAHIYAELSGVGMTADAYHITKPPMGAEGAKAAMELALQDAKMSPEKVDYINAHATSTPAGDAEESLAIESLFAEHAKKLSISSTKSMTGHLLGATGAVEAIFSILALQDQTVPATINLAKPSADCRLDYVPNSARQIKNLSVSMSNSFGFGGTNGTLIFSKI
jgi:3-oxoacyl-[acyl-carrier-protein] synthase II